MSLGISAVLFSGIMLGGLYVIERSQLDFFRTLEGTPKTVSLLLQDEIPFGSGSGGGGGLGPQNAKDPANQREHPKSDLPFAAVPYTQLSAEPLEDLVPLEAPREVPNAPSVMQIPILAGGVAGTGIGNGLGGRIGNGNGNGGGRGRGGTWIHSASSREGIQLADANVEVQDFIPPIYPAIGIASRISGDVLLEVTIDESGRPVKWTVLEGHPCLAGATLEVFPRWRFIPVRYKGERVRATFEVRIRFTLL